MEQRKFLAMVGLLAQADMQKSGILASLTIAQAILESGWGTSELATKANALFGIKADARWSGKAYSKDTKECYDGVTYTTITALFRAYDSWAESVADHSAFLLANKRYAAVVGERDYKAACKAIKAAGYATDPGYPQKLIGLIEKYGLTVYDGKAKQEDKASMNISITKKTSTHNTTAAAGRAIRYIVVHYTAGVTSKPGSAAGTASYFGGTSKQVSADFIVDDGGAVQYNGDIRNRYTWHCGGGKYNTKGGAYYGKATNRNTIGIEVCSTNDTGKMTVLCNPVYDVNANYNNHWGAAGKRQCLFLWGEPSCAVLPGSLPGTLLGKVLPKTRKEQLPTMFWLCSIGVNSVIKASGMTAVVLALLVGLYFLISGLQHKSATIHCQKIAQTPPPKQDFVGRGRSFYSFIYLLPNRYLKSS